LESIGYCQLCRRRHNWQQRTDAVTTAAVGQLAGCSRGIANHHFGSRDQLMARLAGTVQRRFTPRSRQRKGREHVLSVVDDYLALVCSSPRDMRVFPRLRAAAIGDEEPALRDTFAGRDALFRDCFADAIRRGLADGSIPAGIDLAASAVALVSRSLGDRRS
jgi:AcrR family transcriptional regulator